jgi:glycosyltransferase involved in cell wall biosynthesis
MFTVFTPTRNRAHTLPIVYDSLVGQTLRDFEWLIIDNESTDGTEELVDRWIAEADFPIRYVKQPNRGLQGSWNRAPHEARGRFMVTVASDDACLPQALERLLAHWETIPEEDRDRFSAVTALCVDEHGNLIGDRFPDDPTDSDPVELRFRYKVHGEKWGFQRVDVMREFRLPTIDGYTGYIPESLMWDAIGRRYKTRYVNEVLRVFAIDKPGTLSRPHRPQDNAPGGYLEARAVLNEDVRWFRAAPAQLYVRAAKMSRSGLHSQRGLVEQWRDIRNWPARLLWLAALPLGLATYLVEVAGLRRIARPRVTRREAPQ